MSCILLFFRGWFSFFFLPVLFFWSVGGWRSHITPCDLRCEDGFAFDVTESLLDMRFVVPTASLKQIQPPQTQLKRREMMTHILRFALAVGILASGTNARLFPCVIEEPCEDFTDPSGMSDPCGGRADIICRDTLFQAICPVSAGLLRQEDARVGEEWQ